MSDTQENNSGLLPFWNYESALIGKVTVSLRGSGKIPRSVYDTYLNTFVAKYNDKIEEVGKTSTLYANNDDRSEYCTVIYLNGDYEIDYPRGL